MKFKNVVRFKDSVFGYDKKMDARTANAKNLNMNVRDPFDKIMIDDDVYHIANFYDDAFVYMNLGKAKVRNLVVSF